MADNASKLALILATEALAQARAVAKQEGQRGKDGEDGKDATPEQIELSVRSVFAEHAESLRGRDGENGKNVTPEEAETIIRSVVAEIADSLRGKDGRDGVDGQDGQNVTAEQAESLIRAVVAEIAPTLKGKDGRDGVSVPVATVERMVTEAVARAVTVGEQGKPGIVWRGKYDRGTQYYKDDAVRYERSSYIALRDNLNEPPALIGDAWELLAQGGEDGKAGKDGVTKTIVGGSVPAPASAPSAPTSITTFHYKAKTNTQEPPPTTGHIVWNTAIQANATELYLSHISGDNDDIDLFLSFISTGQRLLVQSRNNSTQYQTFAVSGTPTRLPDPNAYWLIPVTLESAAGGDIANNHEVLVGVISSAGMQEVFQTDTPPSISYPAINFTSSGIAGLYLLQVNA